MIDFIEKIKNNVINNENKIAYSINNQNITYKNLWSLSLKYSKYLIKQGNAPVILYGHKGVNMVVSIIACLLAKRTYIPIDLCTPKYRIKKII